MKTRKILKSNSSSCLIIEWRNRQWRKETKMVGGAENVSNTEYCRMLSNSKESITNF